MEHSLWPNIGAAFSIGSDWPSVRPMALLGMEGRVPPSIGWELEGNSLCRDALSRCSFVCFFCCCCSFVFLTIVFGDGLFISVFLIEQQQQQQQQQQPQQEENEAIQRLSLMNCCVLRSSFSSSFRSFLFVFFQQTTKKKHFPKTALVLLLLRVGPNSYWVFTGFFFFKNCCCCCCCHCRVESIEGSGRPRWVDFLLFSSSILIGRLGKKKRRARDILLSIVERQSSWLDSTWWQFASGKFLPSFTGFSLV